MPCRLYLALPPDLDETRLDRFAAALAEALEAADVACVLLRAPDHGPALPAAARLGPVAQAHEAAFLVEDDLEAAVAAGCDGVHLSDPERTRAARRRLGEGAIVGVGCGGSRHAALTAAEAGADYVAFGALGPAERPPDPELLSWWQALMTPPCVALGADGPQACAGLARAGADFVAVSRAVWRHPQGPAAALRAIAAALEGIDPGAATPV